jgi:hypothetical protein
MIPSATSEVACAQKVVQGGAHVHPFARRLGLVHNRGDVPMVEVDDMRVWLA